MKELFERHRDHLTPEEDQAIWGRVEQKLSHRRSFWQSWRFPVSMAATASAFLLVFTLTRGSHELATVNVRTIEPPVSRMTRDHSIDLGQESPQTTGRMDKAPAPAGTLKRAPNQVLIEPSTPQSSQTGTQPAPSKVDGKQSIAERQTNQAAPMADSFTRLEMPPPEAGSSVQSKGAETNGRSFDQAVQRAKSKDEGTSLETLSESPAPSTSDRHFMGTQRQGKPRENIIERLPVAGLSRSHEGAIQQPPQTVVNGDLEKRKDTSGWPNSVGGTTPVNGQAFDAMFFQHYGVNPFIDPEDDKFATFAVDVDNASYTLTRSYLERGALPPAEAVRVEEFVNSMRHDYAPPRNADLSADREWAPSEHGTFAIHLEAAPSPFGPGLVLFRVGLKGKEIAVSERKPANLTFVVDVSGSMQRENRLELVKRSLFYLLDQMNNRDRVALVVYGTNARVVLSPTSLRYRRTIEDAIVSLQPEGSTNAEAGLREGYAIANESFDQRANNRIILCTDGVANVGLTDADNILDTIGRSARRGIALTAIGVGMGNYNDVLIEKLADKGDGNYYYVDDLGEAKKVFVENLTGTLQTIAKDTKIQVEFVSDAVRRYRLLGYENRDVADRDFRNNAVDAGEVGAGHEVTALFEMKLDRRATRGPVATVRIRYQDPETGRFTEEARTLRAEDILSRVQNADPTFKMDAAVAEFAEILRHSYWAKDGKLGDARELARNASRSMDSPKDAEEVVSLIGKAEQLWSRTQPERWQDDDVRPQWEPGQDNEK